MFALVNNPISDSDRLSEIDVANENVRDHSAYVSEFASTDAYDRLFGFIQAVNQSCIGHTLTEVENLVNQSISQAKSQTDEAANQSINQPKSHSDNINQSKDDAQSNNNWAVFCRSLVDMLESIDKIIDAHPPVNQSTSQSNNQSVNLMSRFGNAAFRDFLADLSTKSRTLIKNVITKTINQSISQSTDQSNSQSDDQSINQSINIPVVSPNRHSLRGTAPRGASPQSTNQSTDQSANQFIHQSNHIHLPKNVPQKVIDSLIARGELPPGYVHNQPIDQSINQSTESHTHTHVHDENCSTHDHQSTNQSTSQSTDQSISQSDRIDRWCELLNHYLLSSFGDARRIDYGTGHEMNFFCCLLAFTALFQSINQPINQSNDQSTNTAADQSMKDPFDALFDQLRIRSINQLYVGIGLYVFPRYVKLMRRLQKSFLLEPAGTRGVWGLDDYCFLPFLLGSAQLTGHSRVRPKSVTSKDMLEYCANDYMYFQSIQFILDVKTASFAEHSPMLNDMTIIKDWKSINQGLLRMYKGEILHKYPIIQHFIFTDVLSNRLVKDVEKIDVKAPDICCSDSIRFPSAIAAKQ